MNIKKSKIVLALGGLLFLSAPLSSAFACENHTEMQEMQQGDTMKSIKSELRGYVKGFKADDSQKMQQHLNELLQLSEKATKEIPEKIAAMDVGNEMDHSQMNHADMMMPEMDHSQMDHGDMTMPEMDHSQMDHGEMAMSEMDHSQMDHSDMGSVGHDMSAMPSMEGMSSAQHHQHMIYMQGTAKLKESFKELAKAQDKTEITAILGKIKEHIKKYQLFS